MMLKPQNTVQMKSPPRAPNPSQVEAVAFLRSIYLRRKARNSGYSLTAFARDLGMSRPLLSRIFLGTWPITLKQAVKISTTMEISTDEKKNFLALVSGGIEIPAIKIESQHPAPPFYGESVERFSAISNWSSLAILNLTKTSDFVPDANWIADRLNITRVEVEDTLYRLFKLKLLMVEKGTYVRTKAHLLIETKSSLAAIRSFHRQMIKKAYRELSKKTQADFDRRLITGITYTIPTDSIDPIRREMVQYLDALLEKYSVKNDRHDGTCPQEVYQMNMQFFPLSQRKSSTLNPKKRKKNESIPCLIGTPHCASNPQPTLCGPRRRRC